MRESHVALGTMSCLRGFFWGGPMEYQGAATCNDLALHVTNADFLTTHSPPRGTMPPLGKNPAERRGEPQNQILLSWCKYFLIRITTNIFSSTRGSRSRSKDRGEKRRRSRSRDRERRRSRSRDRERRRRGSRSPRGERSVELTFISN